MRSRLLSAAAACLAAATTAGTAPAADLSVRMGPAAAVALVETPCSRPKVIGRILERFAWAERHTWQRGFVMQRIDYPRLRPDEHQAIRMIPTTFCEGSAVMTDGSVRTVYYTIEEQTGFASIGTGIDFCVLGLDPWYVHDAACRTVR